MNFQPWQIWAVLSAVFAALTAIFAKIGVENVNSHLATFIRTVVVLVSLVLLLLATGQFVAPDRIPTRTWIFLVLSGLGTGASWLCYFRALKLGPAVNSPHPCASSLSIQRRGGRETFLRHDRVAGDAFDLRKATKELRGGGGRSYRNVLQTAHGPDVALRGLSRHRVVHAVGQRL